MLNKVDRLEEKPRLLKLIERYKELHDFAAFIPVSAARGGGLDVQQREIVARLPEGPALFPDDYLTDQPERFLAAEIVREKILRFATQEVPHAVTVSIETWEDTEKLVRISAIIYVEREGQKAILIGAKGSALKKIGTDLPRLGPGADAGQEGVFGNRGVPRAVALARRSGVRAASADWRSASRM